MSTCSAEDIRQCCKLQLWVVRKWWARVEQLWRELSNRALKRREGGPAAPYVSVHHLYTPGPLLQPRLLGKSSLHPCPIIAVPGCKVKTGVRQLDIRRTFENGLTEGGGASLKNTPPIVTHLFPPFIKITGDRDCAVYKLFLNLNNWQLLVLSTIENWDPNTGWKKAKNPKEGSDIICWQV